MRHRTDLKKLVEELRGYPRNWFSLANLRKLYVRQGLELGFFNKKVREKRVVSTYNRGYQLAEEALTSGYFDTLLFGILRFTVNTNSTAAVCYYELRDSVYVRSALLRGRLKKLPGKRNTQGEKTKRVRWLLGCFCVNFWRRYAYRDVLSVGGYPVPDLEVVEALGEYFNCRGRHAFYGSEAFYREGERLLREQEREYYLRVERVNPDSLRKAHNDETN